MEILQIASFSVASYTINASNIYGKIIQDMDGEKTTYEMGIKINNNVITFTSAENDRTDIATYSTVTVGEGEDAKTLLKVTDGDTPSSNYNLHSASQSAPDEDDDVVKELNFAKVTQVGVNDDSNLKLELDNYDYTNLKLPEASGM
jgi:hypothetical protein